MNNWQNPREIQAQPPASQPVRSKSSRSQSRHRHHHSSRGNIQNGKLWLILMLFALEATSISLYYVPAKPICLSLFAVAKTKLLGQLIAESITNTFLTVGILCRQIWCRYIFITILGFRVFAALVLVPTLFTLRDVEPVAIAIMALYGVACLGATLLLTMSRDIQRLADKFMD